MVTTMLSALTGCLLQGLINVPVREVLTFHTVSELDTDGTGHFKMSRGQNHISLYHLYTDIVDTVQINQTSLSNSVYMH